MNSTTNEAVAAFCEYCGRQNPERLPTCKGCGTPLVSTPPPSSESEPKEKSKGLAIFLALIFGPLGLVYVGAWWPAFVMIAIGAPFILTHTGGLWLMIGSRIACAVWAYNALLEQDDAPNARRDSERLLDKGARLESVDRSKAIAAYEGIVRSYPDTAASREATRNIQILKRQL
jgi:hypothetical protein